MANKSNVYRGKSRPLIHKTPQKGRNSIRLNRTYITNQTREDILKLFADRVGLEIIPIKTIEDAIKEKASFGRIIDNTFNTEREKKIIKAKSEIW